MLLFVRNVEKYLYIYAQAKPVDYILKVTHILIKIFQFIMTYQH